MADEYRHMEVTEARSRTLADRVAQLEERLQRFDEDMAAAAKALNQLDARIDTAENELGINRRD